MTLNFGELAAKMGQPLRVFGNLPYNIPTPLMFHLFSYTDAIADMHFIWQRSGESSGCRTEQQGVWSIKRHGAILLQRDPGAGSTAVSLTPPPKVDSAVVRLVPLQRCLTRLKMFAC